MDQFSNKIDVQGNLPQNYAETEHDFLFIKLALFGRKIFLFALDKLCEINLIIYSLTSKKRGQGVARINLCVTAPSDPRMEETTAIFLQSPSMQTRSPAKNPPLSTTQMVVSPIIIGFSVMVASCTGLKTWQLGLLFCREKVTLPATTTP